MKRAIVTGGAGFLGSHLCDDLLKKGYSVIGIDNFITGRPENISHLRHEPRFKFIEHDITKYISIDGPVDAIFHFASPASPIDYQKIPIQTLKAGALGTHNILGVAKAKQARILVASTSEIYGDPLSHPQKEEDWGNVNPIGPRSCYDEAKRFLEAMTMAYHRMHGIETSIARIFNTYGPRQRLDDGRVIPTFMTQALRGEDLTIFGDGNQTRSFCYVDDLIEGLCRLCFSDYRYPVNLGNPTELTVQQVADRVIEITQGINQGIKKTNGRCVYRPLPQDDPRVRRPDITLAKRLLNWEPQIPLEEGLKKSLQYFQERI